MNERRVVTFAAAAMMPERDRHHRRTQGVKANEQSCAEERQQHQENVAVLDLLA
jgi:hypothetical protein